MLGDCVAHLSRESRKLIGRSYVYNGLKSMTSLNLHEIPSPPGPASALL